MAKEYQLTLFGNINDIYRVSCELLEGLEAAEKEGRSFAEVMIELVCFYFLFLFLFFYFYFFIFIFLFLF